jgi:hypothetical protein
MVGRGEVLERGLLTPEQVVAGPLFERLVAELAALNIRFRLTADDAAKEESL